MFEPLENTSWPLEGNVLKNVYAHGMNTVNVRSNIYIGGSVIHSAFC